ncbi:MAG TPA: BatD family protein [Candidatus Polarisedimenticolia bacterium]|nr:BatD family protein [Candidatus Polarisedimenticolia bacterium]
MRRALLAIALIGLAGPGVALAQEVRVRASVDRTSIAEGEDVSLSVEIVASSIDQAAPPDLSTMDEFDVVAGPSVSTRFQWINGRTSASRTYGYVLRPKGSGTRTIPSLGLLVQGRTYRTQSIDVEVRPGGGGRGAPGTPAGPGPTGGGAPRPPAPGRPSGAAPGVAAGGGPDVRVRAEVDERSVFVGQQVTLRVLLDTQTEILNLGLKESPTFPGFWAEEITLPESLQTRRVQIGEATYVEGTLMKRALFPTSSGTLTIPPIAYQLQVRRRSQDPIESFFFTPTESIVRRSDPVTISVRPLPLESKPAGFTGAVGNFTLTLNADRKEAQVNDAIGLKVRIVGEGNLNSVTTPPLPELSDFKQYTPKVTSNSSIQGERLRGEKVWDYVLIPLAPGSQTLPPITFSFFDPKSAEYRSVTSQPISIQVARGAERPGSQAPAVAQSDVRLLRRDIHYIRQAPDGLRDRSRPFYRSPLFAALLLMPLAADLGILVVSRRRGSLLAGARLRRQRRARASAARRLKEARRRLSPPTSRQFYAAVAGALTDYVADKFDTAAAGLTHDRIEDLLVARGVTADLRAVFHRCLEACDYARFAPSSSGQEEMRRTLTQAEETLLALEKSLS